MVDIAIQYSLVPCKKCVIFSQEFCQTVEVVTLLGYLRSKQKRERGEKRSHTICNQWAGNCTEPQTPMGPESLSHLLLS